MKKISFLLGAGASKPFGVPTTEDMAKEFLEKQDDPELEFALGKKNARDIESLIRVVQRIRDLESNEGLTLADIQPPIIDIIRYNSRNFEETQKAIYEFIREKCRSFDVQKAEKIYKPIFDLSKQTPIDIFTTNYDMTIEEVCRTLKISYKDGFKHEEHGYNKIFNPLNFNDGSLRLFKLHGSINWWTDNKRSKIFSFDPQFSGIAGLDNLMIYPAEKEDVFNYPFNILHLFFNVTLDQTNELFAIGHKFGDKNILSTVTAMLERPDFVLTIVDPKASQIKKEVFKNNEKVRIHEKTFEKWVEDGGMMDIATDVMVENLVKTTEDVQPPKTSKTSKQSSNKNQKIDTVSYVPSTLSAPMFGYNEVQYAKQLPEATDGNLLNIATSSTFAGFNKLHRKCPKCDNEFVVNSILKSFNCPHCNVRLYNDSPF